VFGVGRGMLGERCWAKDGSGGWMRDLGGWVCWGGGEGVAEAFGGGRGERREDVI